MPDHVRSLPRPAAVLFDLDGTLVDTVQTRIDAWLEALERPASRRPRDQLAPMIGLDGRRLASEVAALAGRPIDEARSEEIDKASGEIYERLNRPRPLPGVAAVVAAIETAGIKWAIATSSRKDQVKTSVDALGPRRRADDHRRQPRRARQARAGPPALRGEGARRRARPVLVRRRLDLGHGLGGRGGDGRDRRRGRLRGRRGGAPVGGRGGRRGPSRTWPGPSAAAPDTAAASDLPRMSVADIMRSCGPGSFPGSRHALQLRFRCPSGIAAGRVRFSPRAPARRSRNRPR